VADAAEEAEPLEVWPEHWDAVRLFEACDAQWSVHVGMGGLYYQGLDMTKVDTVREWLGIEKSAQLLGQLRVMASEAKKFLNA
jgi:hypothetical protein